MCRRSLDLSHRFLWVVTGDSSRSKVNNRPLFSHTKKFRGKVIPGRFSLGLNGVSAFPPFLAATLSMPVMSHSVNA